MPSGPIKIKDILVQGNYGQKAQAAQTRPEDQPIFIDTGENDPARVEKVAELIQSIATQTELNREEGQITRAITDEFTFYPKNTPFTLEEYKQIIGKTANIAKKLPPDVHLILATFPVIWPDGGIHNCALYVESPKSLGEEPTLHHFSKNNHSPVDIAYQQANLQKYPLTTDRDCTAEQLPDVVLQGTKVKTDDINQSGGALKLTTSDGRELISTVGICLDHAQGVERKDVHHLMSKLSKQNLEVPLHCSHVLTSASIDEEAKHTLSTLSHADPLSDRRRPQPFPARQKFEAISLNSAFSNELSAEIYPSKLIGTVHSDLFQHAVANRSSSQLADQLNKPGEEGNTALHEVFLETGVEDRELIRQRVYPMVLSGADPNKVNAKGQTARNLAQAADQAAARVYYTDTTIESTLDSALAWREQVKAQNTTLHNGHTPLTELLAKGKPNLLEINALILRGANPYLKNEHGDSAIDIARGYREVFDQVVVENQIQQAVRHTQYGHVNSNSLSKIYSEKWFPSPDSLASQEDEYSSSTMVNLSSKSALNFRRGMVPASDVERTRIFEDMKGEIPELIHSVNDYCRVKIFLSLEQEMAVFNSMQTKWSEIIQSVDDFESLMGESSPMQRSIIFNELKEYLLQWTPSVKELGQMMRYLSPKQCADYCGQATSFRFEEAEDFKNLMGMLDSAQQGAIISQYCDICDLIDSPRNFTEILRSLHPDNRTAFCIAAKVVSTKRLNEFLAPLEPEERAIMFKATIEKRPKVLEEGSAESITRLLQQLGPEEQTMLKILRGIEPSESVTKGVIAEEFSGVTQNIVNPTTSHKDRLLDIKNPQLPDQEEVSDHSSNKKI